MASQKSPRNGMTTFPSPRQAPGAQCPPPRVVLLTKQVHQTAPRRFCLRPRRAPQLRVGFVTPNVVLGGAEMWILGLLRYFDPQRIAPSGVAIVRGDLPDRCICEQVATFAQLFAGPLWDPSRDARDDAPQVQRLGSAREAVAAVADRSDVLIVWGVGDLGDHLRGLGFLGRVVLVSHGACEWTKDLLSRSRSAAHRLVAVSLAAAAPFGVPGVAVLHNGADEERCRVTRPRAEVRAAWGARRGDVLAGYVGRFSFEKNPLAVARAALALGPPYRAVYVGDGCGAAEVTALVRGLTTDAIFVPRTLAIGDVMSALDVFVLASPSEGFSLALTEAWLCGLPTVATRVGAVPELEAEHGPLTTPVAVGATPAELGEAVRRALSRENRGVVERARDVAARHYTARAMAERWTRFLDPVVLTSP